MGGACSGLRKKILKMFFINVLHSFFENKPPQCGWIKVNINQHIKRLCTNTLVCLEMRLLCTLGNLKEVLDLSCHSLALGSCPLPAQGCGHTVPWQ